MPQATSENLSQSVENPAVNKSIRPPLQTVSIHWRGLRAFHQGVAFPPSDLARTPGNHGRRGPYRGLCEALKGLQKSARPLQRARWLRLAKLLQDKYRFI
jgi:hypothetical protein